MTTCDVTYAYVATIEKSHRNADGDLVVIGKAAGPELDLDGQRCDPKWLSTAMPKWYEWGNVRAQHSPIAAGTGIELTEGPGGNWTLKSVIVDKDSALKAEKRVYKGYSIGVKGARVIRTATAPNGLIVGGEIVEISLVDRPSNPTATLSVCKSAGGYWRPVDNKGRIVTQQAEAVWINEATRAAAEQDIAFIIGNDPGVLEKAVAAESTADTWSRVERIADYVIAEMMLLKSAGPDDGHDIGKFVEAAQALEYFVDPGYEGMDSDFGDLQKAAGTGAVVNATVVGELVKAAVTEAMSERDTRIETLSAQLAEVRAMPIGGGPQAFVLGRAPESTAQSRSTVLAKSASLDSGLRALIEQRERDGEQ